MSAKRKAEAGSPVAPPLAHKPEMPAEATVAQSPPEASVSTAAPMLTLGEVFPFGAFVQREDGSRLVPGDPVKPDERLSVSTPAASAPPMGFSLHYRIA